MAVSPGELARMMDGFEPEFADPEHYIVDITERIWDDGGVGLIEDWYSADCLVHTPFGTKTGIAPVMDSTRIARHEFGDGMHLDEEILIGGYASGFYSSHRPRTIQTHTGHGSYGPPTGKAVESLGIADCLCFKNQIIREWLVRDNAGIARQLGLDIFDLSKQRLDSASPHALDPKNLLNSWKDPNGTTIIGDKDIANCLIDAWSFIWNDDRGDQISSLYDRGAVIEAPINSIYRGTRQIDSYFAHLFSAFGQRSFKVHHVVVRREQDSPITLAVRWSVFAEHTGPGEFGPLSGSQVAILGISQLELRRGRIVREWSAYDVCSILAQIEQGRRSDLLSRPAAESETPLHAVSD